MTQKNIKSDGTVGKALTLLDIVEAFQSPVRFNKILANSPYPKPSTYRLLQTLVSQNLLSYDPDSGLYNLGTRLIRLAHSAWHNASLAPIAHPFIDELSRTTGQTIHLATLDHGQVLYLDKRNAQKPISMFSNVGKIGPAYCTGVGKAMLAYLETEHRNRLISEQSFYAYTDQTLTTAAALTAELDSIKATGIAFDREEHEPNIICVAVPILSRSGQVLAGLSITDTGSRNHLARLAQFKDDLQKAASLISAKAEIWMLSPRQ